MFQWESQQLSNLMCLIESSKPQHFFLDMVRWKVSSDGKFTVKAFIDHSKSYLPENFVMTGGEFYLEKEGL